MPVRVAAPTNIGGLVDTLLTPAYSTGVGLLQWGATTLAGGEPLRYESAPAMGGLGRPRRPPEHLPVGGWLAGAPLRTCGGLCGERLSGTHGHA